ncbi:unnamed protein product [Durusdinium trenchii]|uniref:Uncharacterized protein n=1 Tax=Durusdinium trenchii TaxID=1381693 RepID=A0ABP0K6R4_9DINO
MCCKQGTQGCLPSPLADLPPKPRLKQHTAHRRDAHDGQSVTTTGHFGRSCRDPSTIRCDETAWDSHSDHSVLTAVVTGQKAQRAVPPQKTKTYPQRKPRLAAHGSSHGKGHQAINQALIKLLAE